MRRLEGASGAQQNVSRFHNLQDKFSSRRPFSMACDVLENKDHCKSQRLGLLILFAFRVIPRRAETRCTYHAKEVFDRCGVDGVKGGDLDS